MRTRLAGVPEFELSAAGPFSLAQSIGFASGFSPTSHSMHAEGDSLRIAFVPDGESKAVSARVRQVGERVLVEADGAEQQVRRILGLDVDGAGFAAVGERDPVVAELQRRWPGFRPLSFPSPFEAGMWFLISQRTQFRHALAIKERLARELGEEVDDGLHAFPSPQAIADLEPVPGVSQVKLERGRALARAALAGGLDGERLRALGAERAIDELKAIPGVGPFTAQGIVVRGANEPDWLPTAEPRLQKAAERLYGPGAHLARLAESWRPYRSWVAVLLRRALT
jgi:DNA-3-methyladenine glycosylase II